MNFDETAEFKKDVKALKKRVPTLRSDLKRACKLVESLYVCGDDMSEADMREYKKLFFAGKNAAILEQSTKYEVVKIRLDTDTNTYRNKLRLVFVAVITAGEVVLVELFSKNDKTREDLKRIKKVINS